MDSAREENEMSRYIDADAVIEKKWQAESEACFYALEDVVSVTDIEEAPTIDIVRCKECKYEPICNHSVQHTTHDAYSVTIGSKTVEWCSYGERREP